jgi:hypothetical protein
MKIGFLRGTTTLDTFIGKLMEKKEKYYIPSR